MSTVSADKSLPYPIPPRFKKEDRPEFVELLKEAKKYLLLRYRYSDCKTFICWAIQDAERVLNTPLGVRCDLAERISKGLQGASTYTVWLTSKEKFASTGEIMCKSRVQEARHRWVDQMIEDFGGTP